jgi:hypothetical protein
MRILLLALLGLLSSCAGAPTAGTNPSAVSANPREAGAASDIHGFSAAVWEEMSKVERSEAIAEQEMLADLAKKGIYPENQPCQVTVKDHRSGVTIGLYNEGYIDQSTYYTESRASASYKVVPNLKMGALLKALEDQGYFEAALPGIKKVRGAFVSIVVRRGADSWTLSWGEALGDKNKEVTYRSMDSVRVVFDTQLSIQVVNNPNGSNFFEGERNRINTDNAEQLSNREH